ncbi:hypothetical protein [Paraburkholderia sp. GAS348]|uniref:hypothetical protein n=1 Tax=Paraburkholderia sp. GAS348 TaxID=3035132 RepID=UPI003D1BD003
MAHYKARCAKAGGALALSTDSFVHRFIEHTGAGRRNTSQPNGLYHPALATWARAWRKIRAFPEKLRPT